MTEAEILRSIERVGALTPFKVESVKQTTSSRTGFDAIVRLSLDGKSKDFAVEIAPRSVSRDIRERAARVRESAQAAEGGRLLPLVVCPYIRPELARELLETRVSVADMCGNISVVVPRTWYVERLGSPNQYPESKPLKNPYRGTSSLVSRVLANGERFDTATSLIARIESLGGEITKATVSKALRTLVDEGLAERDPRIRVTDRVRLIELLSSNYRPPAPRRSITGTVADLGAWSRAAATRADAKGIRLSGFAPERYADFPSSYEQLRVFTDSAAPLLEDSGFKEGDRWPNLTVIETDDPTVYFDLRTEDGFGWCPPLEVFLALRAGGKRERDTAEGLLGRVLADPEPPEAL